MNLQQAAVGRNNNLNLMRMVAAFAVLVSHSFLVKTGSASSEPGYQSLGCSLGALSVDVFFVASGFLVTASLLKRDSAADFLRARALRIFPAAAVSAALTVFLLGPLVSTATSKEYFGALTTWEYLLRCTTLIGGAAYRLPGVFETNAYPNSVNSSLWTMPWELRMYALLLLLWLATRILGGAQRAWFERSVVLIGVAGLCMLFLQKATGFTDSHLPRFCSMFFVGGAMHVHARRIPLRRWMGPAAGLTLMLGAWLGASAFPYFWALVAPYLVVWCAYVPKGPILAYCRLGDYSYGTYIFAFPLQQLVFWMRPESSILELTCIAGAGTLVLAVLSWHFVEKPALRFAASRSKVQVADGPRHP